MRAIGFLTKFPKFIRGIVIKKSKASLGFIIEIILYILNLILPMTL